MRSVDDGRGDTVRRIFLAITAVTALLIMGAPGHAVAASIRNGELVADGAWSWFQDPRAVHYVGVHDRTYIGYVTPSGDIDVVSQDNRSAAMAHSRLHVALASDDHAAPGLEVLPSRHIAVFYSGHSGAKMYYRISKHAEDIGSFGPEHALPVKNNGARGFTYANPIYLSDEHRTYLFFRGGNFKPSVTWSDDNLHTWAPIRTLIIPDALQTSLARPYVQYATNGFDTIVFAFTDGHPRDIATNSVYALRYRAGVIRRMDGVPVATLGQRISGIHPIPVHTRSVPPLYDGSGPDGKAWVQDAALDRSGAPVVAFASFPRSTDHRYHYARWTGTRWVQTAFAKGGGSIDTSGKEPDYSGGVALNSADPAVVYTSRVVHGQWEIQRWRTTDGGRTFGCPVAVTRNSSGKNVRPVVPWGPPGRIKVLWMAGRYTHYSNGGYQTQIRELTSGPAPTTTRMSVAGTSSGRGTRITGRVVRGVGGVPIGGVPVVLWGHRPGQAYHVVRTARTNSQGLVHFTVTQRQAMRYQLRTAGSATWGSSQSASAVVHRPVRSAMRISGQPSVVRPGTAVVIGMRVVNAGNRQGLAGAHAQLWQRVGAGRWRMRGTFTLDRHGLASVRVRPARGAYYQARYVGNAVYGSSKSAARHVMVRG